MIFLKMKNNDLLTKKIELINLFNIYQNILTESQKKYFYEHIFLDLSLSELSENYNVSRNAIFLAIKNATKKMIDYENKLNILKKTNEIKKLLDKYLETNNKQILEKIKEIF